MRVILSLVLSLVATVFVQAQSPNSLPQNPTAKSEQQSPETTPCPSGVGKPCALLAGRAYFPDLFHNTEHDKTLWDAFKHRGIWMSALALNASTVADIEGTQHCLAQMTCIEANPIYGKHPSRARAYGIAMPVNVAAMFTYAYLKKRGDGNFAMMTMWSGTIFHTVFAATGFLTVHANTVHPSSASEQK